MAITPTKGYIVDPNNTGGVIRDPNVPVSTTSPIPVSTLTATPTPINVATSPTIPTPVVPTQTNTAPAGWDAVTYANFKKANPTLEPTAEDTAIMLGAGTSKTPLDPFISSLQALEKQYSGRGAETATETARLVAPKEQALSEIDKQLGLHQANAIAREEEALNRVGGTTTTNAIAAQQERRTSAIESLRLSAIKAGIQGDIALATKQVETAITAKYGQVEADINTARTNIQNNWDTLTPAQQKIASATLLRLDKEDAFVKEQKERDKTAQTYMVKVSENTANFTPTSEYRTASQALDAIGKATPEEAVAIATATGLSSGTDPLDRAYKIAQINKLNADIRGLNVPQITNPNASEYKGALSVILGSAKFTKEQKASVIEAVNNGEDPVAVIKNQAKQIMTGANQTKIESYETAQSSLKDLANDLDAFYAAGGSTNIFSGNYEKVINKLGNVNNPKLVELATRIQQNLQIYRNAVSGTAYSVQEGNDIAAIFPAITKGQILNNAIIKGRMKAFDDGIDGAYRGVLGSTYDSLKAVTPPETPPIAPEKTAVFNSVIQAPTSGGYFSNLWKAISGQ